MTNADGMAAAMRAERYWLRFNTAGALCLFLRVAGRRVRLVRVETPAHVATFPTTRRAALRAFADVEPSEAVRAAYHCRRRFVMIWTG